MKNLSKNNRYSILGTLGFVSIVTCILGICKLLWWYYPIGVFISCLTHFIMILQNKRFYHIAGNRFEREQFEPKKDAFLWYGLRILVLAISFTLIVVLSHAWDNPRALEIVILSLAGYMTVKIIFILVLLLLKEEGR